MYSISVIWLPGPNGVERNEGADKATKNAALKRRIWIEKLTVWPMSSNRLHEKKL